jgi:hypothetical protein
MISLYILGLLAVNSILLLWFYSPLKLTLAKLIFKKDLLTGEQFDDILAVYSLKLSTLSGCYICCSFWSSLVIGILLSLSHALPLCFPLITFLTYPALCYIFKVYVLEKKP